VIEVDESSKHEKKIYRLLEIKNRIDNHLNSKECSKCKKKIHISSFSAENGECNKCKQIICFDFPNIVSGSVSQEERHWSSHIHAIAEFLTNIRMHNSIDIANCDFFVKIL